MLDPKAKLGSIATAITCYGPKRSNQDFAPIGTRPDPAAYTIMVGLVEVDLEVPLLLAGASQAADEPTLRFRVAPRSSAAPVA
jgi:hypothetical protein